MPSVKFFLLVVTTIFLAGCAYGSATTARIPSGLTTYDKLFMAASDMAVTTGYSITRADKESGAVTATKIVAGNTMHLNLLIKRAETGLQVNLTNAGGKYPLPTAVWKSDAAEFLRTLTQSVSVPPNQVSVTFGNETTTLDKM